MLFWYFKINDNDIGHGTISISPAIVHIVRVVGSSADVAEMSYQWLSGPLTIGTFTWIVQLIRNEKDYICVLQRHTTWLSVFTCLAMHQREKQIYTMTHRLTVADSGCRFASHSHHCRPTHSRTLIWKLRLIVFLAANKRIPSLLT